MYYIAYLDADGNGFSENEPYVAGGMDSAEQIAFQMILIGENCGQKVTVFYVKLEEELPECITWEFVESHNIFAS